jgi:membrane-associated phospholipid phosphatase
MPVRLVPVVTLVHLLLWPAAGLAQVEVGSQKPPPVLSRGAAVAAGLVLAATLMGDQGLRGEIQEYRGVTSNSMAQVGNAFGDPRYVLPALGAGFLASRLLGDAATARATLRVGGAVALAGGITSAVKLLTGRNRPQGDGDPDQFKPFSGRNSFPSGHTAVAFALATALAHETPDRWSDAVFYGTATLTAFARLNDDRHWTSDVIAGALVGHLSARWLTVRRGGLTASPGTVALSIEF